MAEPLPPFVMWLHKMMRYLPHLAIVASLLVYAFFILTERYSSIFNLSLYLIPLIGISIVLIVNKKFSCDDSAALFNISFKRLRNIHLIIFALTIICLGFGHDGWLYLGLMFVQYCLLLAQLFAKDQSAKWIVAGVMLTTSILVLPQMLIPAYYCGDGDLLFHAGYAKTIIDMGTVATGYGGVYESFNAYHILIAAFAETTGLAINVSLYLVSVAAVLFSVPIVYALAKFFTKSERIGGWSAYIYTTLPMTIYACLAPAPRVLASMVFFQIFYLSIIYLVRYPRRTGICIALSIIYMVLVHHAQLLFIILVTFGLLTGYVLYSNKLMIKHIACATVLLLIPIMALLTRYWDTLYSIIQTRLLYQIETGNVKDILIESAVDTGLDSVDQLFSINFEYTLAQIFVTAIIVFTFVGIYTLIDNYSIQKKTLIILPLVIVTFVVFVPGIVDLFPSISEAFQIYRLRFVLVFFFAIIMAIGIVTILNFGQKTNTKYGSLILVIGLCIVLVVSGIFVSEFRGNEVFCGISDRHVEHYLTEGDIATFNILSETIPYKEANSKLYSDYEHARYPSTYGNNNPFVLTSYHIYSIFTEENSNTNSMSYLLFPENRYFRLGLHVFNGYTSYGEPEEHDLMKNNPQISRTFYKNIYLHNSIYDNEINCLYYRI